MKGIKLIALTAVALTSLMLTNLALAQPEQSIVEDRTVWVEFKTNETDLQAVARYADKVTITKEQAIAIAQKALFNFSKPDSITLSLKHFEGDKMQHFLVWEVVFGEFNVKVDAGTGYAYTGYVDHL